ncbi:uncharacterized protein LOC110029942 [Phalaenopsis equestris]|uniref:uncharacterized protein LOC110029942 n=1 Tax=Phalaenopsis equestris TaxID=78828 RepID=UPI0009E4DF43|nr:uncharacterized protein LOC110029942 [Phalaenopsis equestris]
MRINFQLGNDMISSNLLFSSFSLPPQWALLASPNPSPASTVYPSSPPSPIHARRFLCRCRRRHSSSDPNAESVRAGRFGFGDKGSSGEVSGDFGQGGPRRWWSDGNLDGDFKEEFDSIDEEEEDGEQLWDKIWIFKVFKSYGYLLPAIIASILLATGPKAFLMALALPLGQSAISLSIEKLWGGGKEETRTSPRSRRKRKPFSASSYDFRKQEQDESGVENEQNEFYKSWVATENGFNDGRGKFSGRSRFGGWDELDQPRRPARRRAPPGAGSSFKSAPGEMGKLSKKGRYRDAPLFLRLLIAVFPFLGSWIKIM